MKKIISLLAVSMLALSACGQASAQTSAQTGPAKVTVSMTEWSVNLSQTSIPAGEVTFVLKNTGTITHELIIAKTDLAQDKMPMASEDPLKVDESASIGEIGDVEAGQTKEDIFNLAPGNYVLMCNEQSHYMSGMHIAFTVK